MFNQKINGMTVVHEDTLSFVSYVGDAIQVDHSVSLGLFLEDDFELPLMDCIPYK